MWEPGINALARRARASACAGGCSAGSASAGWSTASGWSLLFGFSTQILWVTTRGGVWHTGHLIATILTLACLIELWGRQRAWLIGLLAGAAFLTRAPLAFAIPFYALMLDPAGLPSAGRRAATSPRRHDPVARLGPARGSACCRRSSFFFAYNQVRFGDPLESGYALATLPPFLDQLRAAGPVLARRTSG